MGNNNTVSRSHVVNDIMIEALLKTSQNCFTGLSSTNTMNLSAHCPEGAVPTLRGVHQTASLDLGGASCSLTTGVQQDTEAKLRNAVTSSATSDKDGLGGFLAGITAGNTSSISDISNTMRQKTTIETLNSCFSDMVSGNTMNSDFCKAGD
jgi:hypothetical protein